MSDNRFLLQHSQTQPDGWVCTDTENGVVIRWTERRFNDTQKTTFLYDVHNPDPLKIARIMREMADWIALNHMELV